MSDGEELITLRSLGVLAATLLCGCALIGAGCGGAETTTTTQLIDTAVTTTTESPTETIVTTETMQLYPVRVDGKWGFIDNAGTIKIEPRFAGIRRLDGEGGLIGFSEELCAVQLAEN